MASNWIYYPQSSLVSVATLDEDIGTSASISNVLNNRKNSKLEVDTVSAGIFRFQIDLGSGNTLTPDFVAVVNNNINSAAAGIFGLMFSSTDTLSGTSPGGSPLYAFSVFPPTAAQESICIQNSFAGAYTKRYWWIEVTSTDVSLYMGQVLLGNKINPSIDSNWEQPIEYDIESGRIVNITPGGTKWKTRTHGVRRGWSIYYESISTADKVILEALWSDSAVDVPFVYTNDGGTNYYYADIIGNPLVVPVTQGLWNVSFSIAEIIA